MLDGFWAVVKAKSGASAWEWRKAPRDQTCGTLRVSQYLTHGKSRLEEEEPGVWSEWTGCKTLQECNIRIIFDGIIHVAVGQVTRHFGPGQPDGCVIAILDVLDPINFPNGHRIKVISWTTYAMIEIHRQQAGD